MTQTATASKTADSIRNHQLQLRRGPLRNRKDLHPATPTLQPSSTDSNAPATCVICFEDNVNIRTECCKKSYHMMCILKWVITSPTCPSCRELFIDDPSYRTTLLASAPGPFEHARAQMYNLQLNLQAVMQAEGHGQYGQTPSYEGSEDGDGDDDEDAWVDEDEDEEEEFDYDEDDEDGLDSNGSYEDSDSSSQEESVESDEDLEFNEPQETVELRAQIDRVLASSAMRGLYKTIYEIQVNILSGHAVERFL
ncbi:hypothetical protein BC829DRAFT_445873 [Chytridium lagenaria]|nr:hypothetical protein BC829DRAFT_445873 [Chytridium lagenaria]